ncbi:unnamed protein product [Caenorhabditis bovis]|uniref:mitogen-activated protein kinase kinase n=1 Tax=Caenorhabditis bovis TaxID=2654633 RepID=A0A8S1ECW3_9PELO|nr:unnamed protein product [Caenorhabditis bovis]
MESRRGRGKFAKIVMPTPIETPTMNLEDKCKIKLTNESEEIEIRAVDLIVLEELGKGGYGVVEKMKHRQSDIVMAVKMVRFYGAMFREGDVWICMEVMDTSLDKFYRKAYKNGLKIPEPFIGKMALSVIEGLNFMKEQLNLIHRDVKPSNILLNRHGQVKICDFGISGHLTNSLAKTVQAGCKPYMPPERIDGETKSAYDVRADVWSLGITIVEIATGTHPYAQWKTPFDQLKQVVKEPPPRLPMNGQFTTDCQFFVKRCLEKNYNERPKYPELLAMPFMEMARNDKHFSMSRFINEILDM